MMLCQVSGCKITARKWVLDEFRMSNLDNNYVTCLIIDAGLAGLIAARELQRSDAGVVVLGKGRGVGGRLCLKAKREEEERKAII